MFCQKKKSNDCVAFLFFLFFCDINFALNMDFSHFIIDVFSHNYPLQSY
uniref:Uncharacterized protein n=1 Tax=Lepeophtheirus salmonis TaxID=72036 RepID=A0A0K2TPY0_LEPSM